MIEVPHLHTVSKEAMAISLYAKGLTTRDIASYMKMHQGVDMSQPGVSTITDKVFPLVKEWQTRPHIAFLWKEVDNPDILKQVSINPKVDRVKYVTGALLWNVDLKNWSKSAMCKFISTKVTKQVTVRSVNTVRKLNQMMSVLK
ncbi:transposase [Candidatus Kaiserbacteria bacterium]|nr:transposase [Candidatus Kaiserbacteria bacterium]